MNSQSIISSGKAREKPLWSHGFAKLSVALTIARRRRCLLPSSGRSRPARKARRKREPRETTVDARLDQPKNQKKELAQLQKEVCRNRSGGSNAASKRNLSGVNLRNVSRCHIWRSPPRRRPRRVRRCETKNRRLEEGADIILIGTLLAVIVAFVIAICVVPCGGKKRVEEITLPSGLKVTINGADCRPHK
eukprot:s1409_g7.t1